DLSFRGMCDGPLRCGCGAGLAVGFHAAARYSRRVRPAFACLGVWVLSVAGTALAQDGALSVTQVVGGQLECAALTVCALDDACPDGTTCSPLSNESDLACRPSLERATCCGTE